MALLEVQNIKKSFGKNEVLKGISFELNKGEVLAIIGSSGSGKTTLLRCLNYLEVPDDGKIVVDGENVFNSEKKNEYTEANIRDLRLHFGLVFQSFNLFPQYTVLDNIMLAPKLKIKEGIKNKTISTHEKGEELNRVRRKAEGLLDMVGLSNKLEAYPFQLSGGQQQRVAIARALALEPDILCFDEPTSALDPELTVEVLRVIKDLKKTGKTMVIVTHEMEFAKSVSDRVIYMRDGIIEAQGTPTEVFDNPENEHLKQFLNSGKAI
ncbi:MAG: amino acid ABC transporter ATP-binding protein [Ruminococcaceae bacterium]|nr:amino acid ABC transporter ATP-binding protein [Oscillospiraceae bacterium]